MSDTMREQTVMMARIKNEARWIGRNLERTWQVCSKVVLLDDGSTDATESVAFQSLLTVESLTDLKGDSVPDPSGDTVSWIAKGTTLGGFGELHFLKSPYIRGIRPKERVNEIRDKNHLWYYVKGAIDFRYVLALDGDEMLSNRALRGWPAAMQLLQGKIDMLTLPYIYLWDSETKRRNDGIYGNASDQVPHLRFPRLFTIRRVDPQTLFEMRFHWVGQKGGFHCGSIPQEAFQRIGPVGAVAPELEVIHFGYIDDPLRQSKFVFYNEIDPGNEGEGCYLHIIGQPDQHAPGPVNLIDYYDK